MWNYSPIKNVRPIIYRVWQNNVNTSWRQYRWTITHAGWFGHRYSGLLEALFVGLCCQNVQSAICKSSFIVDKCCQLAFNLIRPTFEAVFSSSDCDCPSTVYLICTPCTVFHSEIPYHYPFYYPLYYLKKLLNCEYLQHILISITICSKVLLKAEPAAIKTEDLHSWHTLSLTAHTTRFPNHIGSHNTQIKKCARTLWQQCEVIS